MAVNRKNSGVNDIFLPKKSPLGAVNRKKKVALAAFICKNSGVNGV